MVTAAVVFAVALAASGGVISGAAYARRPGTVAQPAPPVTVQMAGSSTFFSDPTVEPELRRLGLVVQETSLGSRQVCGEPALAQRYDVANSGSQDAAACVLQELTAAGRNAHKSNPFSSPMVIITYTDIVSVLKAAGIATTVKCGCSINGITIFDIRKYLKAVSAGTRWTGIKGNGTYRNRSRILLATTNPLFSNSGGMFTAIAYAALNNDDPFTGLRPNDSSLAVIRQCFAELGNLDTHTPDLLRQFLTEGEDAIPMAMVYESDYVFTKLSGQAGLNPKLTVMYPNPDVISDNTLVSWTPRGNKLTSLLTSPAMQSFEERHGYRTSGDSTSFVAYMKARHITVPDLGSYNVGLQFVSLPSSADLQQLIYAVFPS
jgi:hypothetical protein